MKSAWTKNNLRELKKTLGRFLAMVTIVALGVAFFVGLKSSRPAMVGTCSHYLDDLNFFDLQLVSSIAFDKDDAEAFAALDGVAAAEGSITAPMLTEMDHNEQVFETRMLLPSINQVRLTAGRMPQAPNEVLADDLALGPQHLGLELTVDPQDPNPFALDTYTVVGLCTSPLYLGTTRGSTSLGNGTLRGFLYLLPEGYDTDYYTEVFIRLDGERAPFEPDYLDHLEELEDFFMPTLEEQGRKRLDHFYDEGRQKLDDGWAEYNDGLQELEDKKAEVEAEFQDAEAQLKDARAQLDSGYAQLADGEAQLAQLQNDPYSIPELAEARQMLDEGYEQYKWGLNDYVLGKKQFDEQTKDAQKMIEQAEGALSLAEKPLADAQAAYNAALQAFNEAEAALRRQQEELYAPVAALEQQLADAQAARDTAEAALDQAIADGDLLGIAAAKAEVDRARANVLACRGAYETARAAYDAQAAILEQQLDDARTRLEQAKTVLDQMQSGVDALRAQIEDGKAQLAAGAQMLANAERQLEDARQQLEDGELELKNQIADATATAQTELNDARYQLADGQRQYDEGVQELADGRAEAADQFADAEKELDDAYRELMKGEADLKRMEDPSYFILNPGHNNGFSSFDNDSNIIASVANVFPLFFFLVAALVCSSTMTRMVEEQRTQNGTLKAMGYSDFQIMTRYAGYAGFAAIIGVIVGVVFGTYLFPYVIWDAYKLLYHFGELEFTLQWPLVIISLIAALVCCVGAAVAAAWNDLRQMPAQLMRPKAPKAGKRIFLEYIKPLWNHMSFLAKVSMRNIFRYKKRLFMMIMGTGGCLALLIAGMGLKDSISNVADDQYDNISLYDYTITFDSNRTPAEQEAFRSEFEDDLDDCVFVAAESLKVPADRGTKDLNLVATNDPAIKNLVGLSFEGQPLDYPTGDGLYVSHALAEDLNLHIGDTLPIMLETNARIEIPVTGIFTNYVFHCAYMTADGYETWFGAPPELKTALASTSQDPDAVNTRLQSGKDVVNVTTTQAIRDIVADSMNSLDAVVALVVSCAAALSFVVGYNLININITERVREIATIKVLGFYRKETHTYVFKESVILTFMGTIVGIPLGIWLHRFIMNAVTVDFVTFQLRIAPLSFLIAVVITILVTLVVNAILSRKIDRINMAESLKSVE